MGLECMCYGRREGRKEGSDVVMSKRLDMHFCGWVVFYLVFLITMNVFR